MSETNEQLQVSAFGYSLIRDTLIPELLGKHTPEILYWAGKNIARQHPLENEGEILHFFEKADWGTLAIVKQKKEEMILELTGDVLLSRMNEHNAEWFTLEAGFLAEQFSMMKGCLAEAIQEKVKKKSVLFTVQWDSREPYELPPRKVK